MTSHRDKNNEAFHEAQTLAVEAGLSGKAILALDRMRMLFNEFVYTEVPTISVFANRKQIKIACSNAADESAEYDGTFEATVEDSGNVFVISKKLNGDGSTENRQWVFSSDDLHANLNSHYWLAFVKLPEPIEIDSSLPKLAWDTIMPTFELSYYDGTLDFYGINMLTDKYVRVIMSDMEEMNGTRYYDVYAIPRFTYYAVKTKYVMLNIAWKIMPQLYSRINNYILEKRNKDWYDKDFTKFKSRFKKIAWTVF